MKISSRLAVAGLIFSGVMVAGVLSEGMVRLYAKVNLTFGDELRRWDPMAILIEPHGERGYRQRPNKEFSYWDGTVAHSNGQGFRGPEVAIPKPGGTYRIILLGGSTTHGWRVDDNETIDAFLRDILPASLPQWRIEVVNLAFDGYDSYQVYERLVTDGLAMEPDLIIVNTGVNDVRNARYPDLVDRDLRTMIWEADLARLREERLRGGPSLETRLKHHLMVLRLPGMIRQSVMSPAPGHASKPIVPNPEALAYFSANLARIQAAAAQADVPVLYSTAPSALLTRFLPTDENAVSYWIVNAETTQAYRDKLSERLQQFVATQAAAGYLVAYVPHQLEPEMFLDDCHLNPAGNREMALDFADAITSLLRYDNAGAG